MQGEAADLREFVHLASGPPAGDVLRETLERLGRAETVLAMRDAFAEGPLGDVDAGCASRIAWHARIAPELTADELPRDDSDLWEWVRAGSSNVMLWHGPHPVERIFALRACWRLRDMPERVYEVALAPIRRRWRGGGDCPAFYDAVAIAGPNVTVAAWRQRSKVLDVSERARRWEKLRTAPGDWIRLLDGETIVELPVTAYDAMVVDACLESEWTSSSQVVGGILAYHPIGHSLLTWRIGELLRAGVLEGRGERPRSRPPAQLRRASPAPRQGSR